MTKKMAGVIFILLLLITVLVLIFLLIDSNTRLNSLQNQLSNLEAEYNELQDIKVQEALDANGNSETEEDNEDVVPSPQPLYEETGYTTLRIEECGLTLPYPNEAGWSQEVSPPNYSHMYNADHSIKIWKQLPNLGTEGAHFLTIKCWKDTTTTLGDFRSELDTEIAAFNEESGVCQLSVDDERYAGLSGNVAIMLTQEGCMLPTQTAITRNDEYLYQFDYIVPRSAIFQMDYIIENMEF